jgi:excisionase family DNA binding protein
MISDKKVKNVFTVKEAADFLECHVETIRRAIKKGELKAAFLGKTYRISKESLEEYFKAKGGGRLF